MSNKIFAETLKKINAAVSPTETITIGEVDGTAVEMTVKRFLSVAEFSELVGLLSYSEWIENEYAPVNAKIYQQIKVVEYYSNLTLPADPLEAYEIINNLGIYRTIVATLCSSQQWFDLTRAVEATQKYQLEQNTGATGLLNSIKSRLDTFDVADMLAALKDFDPEALKNLGATQDNL